MDKKIVGYGATSKIIITDCVVSTQNILIVFLIQQEKIGKFTPGTHIPIIDMSDFKKYKKTMFICLPGS